MDFYIGNYTQKKNTPEIAQSKVRASPSAPAFTERVNKAIVEQASPAYSDHSMITLRKINN